MGRTFSYDYRNSDIRTLSLAGSIVIYPRSVRIVGRMGGWALVLVGTAAGVTFGLSFGWVTPLPTLRFAAGAIWGIAGAMIAATLGNVFLNEWVFMRTHGAKALEGQPITVEFSETGFVRRSPHVETAVHWPAVDCAVESYGSIYIASGHAVNFIPKRAFEGPAARQELLSWVIDQLTPVARDRSMALRRR